LDPKWYLVKTKALNETQVHTRLTGTGYEVLFPKIEKKSGRHRRVVLLPNAVSSHRLTVGKDSLEPSCCVSEGLRRSPNLRAACFNSGNMKSCAAEPFCRWYRQAVSPFFRRLHGR
jgi:hypothetical protein